MAKNRSDSSKYESRQGGGWITSAQFLAEVMCERYAKKNGEELVYKFWNVAFAYIISKDAARKMVSYINKCSVVG